MTDKEKQYLIAEIERLKDCASPIVICDTLLSFIDSMQEEPVSKQKLSNVERTVKNWKEETVNKDFEMALAEMIDKAQKCVVEPLVVAEQWKDELIKLAKSEEPVSDEQVKKLAESQHEDKTCKNSGNSLTEKSETIDFEQELYKAFGQIKDFTLGVAIAKRFYDMGRKHNEPVSEDLEEAAKNHAYSCHTSKATGERIAACIYDFKAGAKWQKEQFEKNRLKHCNSITNEQAELEQCFIDQHLDKYQRMPTFLDAIEYGMRLQQEQMMANATDVTVHIDAGNYPYIQQIELYDYDKDIPLAKEGDKYKVVLIKEG